jgi:hypothetical protein
MAKVEDITVTVRMRVEITFWHAFKLRLSGAGYALKQMIEVEIENRNDAAERDHPIS